MTAATTSPQVDRFAAAVRSALGDLPAEEVDELTDGLEAVVLDRLDDIGDSALDDPDAYAAELRSAAGLPPRGEDAARERGSLGAAIRNVPGAVRREATAFVDRHPLVGRAVAFLGTLRPLWWIFRALAAYLVIGAFLGWWSFSLEPIRVLVFLALAVVSIQFGRGRWLPLPWMGRTLRVADVLLAIASPFVAAALLSSVSSAYAMASYQGESWVEPIDGVTVDGQSATNLFIYDEHGELVPGARVYDQNGDPVEVYDPDMVGDYAWNDEGRLTVPSDRVPGERAYNVYPLDSVSERDLTDRGTVDRDAVRRTPTAPFERVAPLVGAVSTDESVTAEMTPEQAPTPNPVPIP